MCPTLDGTHSSPHPIATSFSVTPTGFTMKRLVSALVILSFLGLSGAVFGAPKKAKSKFYDFSDQLIDGEIKKPTALYTDARQQVKFDRLLSLKKSFLSALLQTSKERVFK